MNKPGNMSRTKQQINRWSYLLKLFKTNNAKSVHIDSITEISKPWRRRPSAMSDDSAFSCTPSEDYTNENVTNLHKLYTHAMDEVSTYRSCNSISTNLTLISTLLTAGVCSGIFWFNLLYQWPWRSPGGNTKLHWCPCKLSGTRQGKQAQRANIRLYETSSPRITAPMWSSSSCSAMFQRFLNSPFSSVLYPHLQSLLTHPTPRTFLFSA